MKEERKKHLPHHLIAAVSAAIAVFTCAAPGVKAGTDAMSYMLDQYSNIKENEVCTQAECRYSLPLFDGSGPSIAALNSHVDEIRASFREEEAAILDRLGTYEAVPGEWDALSVIYETEESFHSGDLRTLHIEHSSYTGGAHGFYAEDFLNVNITQGTWLALTDAVSCSEEEFESLLREAMWNSGRAGDISGSPEEVTGERSLSDYLWSFTAEGLAVHFGQYEIGSYAAGTFCFVIPYDRLSMKVDPGTGNAAPAEDAGAQQDTEAATIQNGGTAKETGRNETAQGDSTGIHKYAIVMGDITWDQARKKTLAEGCHLARLNTPEEYDAVTRQIEAEGLSDYYFFIGGHRDNDRIYHWIDDNGGFFDEDLTSGWYASRWMKNEPSFYDPEKKTNTGEVLQEACLVLKKFEGTWVLNDVPGDLVGAYYGWLAGKVGYVAEYD
ncbi:MAG: DUF3298 domain-containing protein [Lachnospiraceae bacterium]|nr:DUF3298 domain-containing protein [Lachnospiraceae bacterium]